MLDRLRELGACAVDELSARRERRSVVHAYAEGMSATLRALQGRPPDPHGGRRLRCSSCPHPVWKHTDRPGAGCTVAACLCLTPLSVVRREG